MSNEFDFTGISQQRSIKRESVHKVQSTVQAQSYNDVGSDEIEIDIDDPPMLTVSVNINYIWIFLSEYNIKAEEINMYLICYA